MDELGLDKVHRSHKNTISDAEDSPWGFARRGGVLSLLQTTDFIEPVIPIVDLFIRLNCYSFFLSFFCLLLFFISLLALVLYTFILHFLSLLYVLNRHSQTMIVICSQILDYRDPGMKLFSNSAMENYVFFRPPGS